MLHEVDISAPTGLILGASRSQASPRMQAGRDSPQEQSPGRRPPSGALNLARHADQLKPIQRPPAAVATQERIDITAIKRATRPPGVASCL